MTRLTLRYVRYALSSPSAVAFGISSTSAARRSAALAERGRGRSRAARARARPLPDASEERMLLTAVAQLRLAASVAFGVPFAPWSLDRLVDALLATRREFGAVAPEGAELLTGVALDDETRRELQLRRFRQQAVRGARETAYYGRLFAGLGLDPGRLTPEDVARLPLTPKAALRDDPGAFVRRGTAPAFRTTTTGTTGRPTSVYFTARELETTAALSAIGLLVHGQLGPEDVVQVSTSARATLGNTCFARACARIGAVWSLTGLVEPEPGPGPAGGGAPRARQEAPRQLPGGVPLLPRRAGGAGPGGGPGARPTSGWSGSPPAARW